jgi:hypothetical protein
MQKWSTLLIFSLKKSIQGTKYISAKINVNNIKHITMIFAIRKIDPMC